MIELPKLSAPSFPNFPHIDMSTVVSTPVLMAVMALFFVFYFIVSSVLVYHWSAYGMRSVTVVVAEGVFVVVSIALFVVAGLSIHYF
jgi:hypothetical protein